MAPQTGSEGGQVRRYLASLVRFWKSSYASDYFGFLSLLVAYIMIEFWVDPFHRMFHTGDLTISFPHAQIERVPVVMNFVYSLFVPLFVMLLYNAVTGADIHKHHVTLLGIAIALVLASTLTDIIKNMVGRPRPDLLSRCIPNANTPQGVLVSFEVCTQTEHNKLHDGWRSFPSGHSSFAFAGLGYVSLFLAGQLKVFVLKRRGPSDAAGEGGGSKSIHVRGDLGKALICMAPLLGAVMIAISRCQDYRHDVYDVCVGALLGWVVTYWSYRRYWPRLNSPHCDEPYPPPIPLKSDDYGRLRDEEEGSYEG